MSARSTSAALAVCLLFAAPAMARTPEAIAVERRANEAETALLEKKTAALGAGLDRRRDHLRRRLRALYKVSQGGYLRLLASAGSPAELFARRDGARRVIRRDLDELSSVRRELDELADEQTRLAAQAAQRDALVAAAQAAAPHRLARRDSLYRPVGGPIVARFGEYHDPLSGLALSRDGVELLAKPGEPVRAIAPGVVAAVEEVPGLGLAVIVDHGDGWRSLLGRLAAARVKPGDTVAAGQHLAAAPRRTIHLQLSEGNALLDPTPWLAR